MNSLIRNPFPPEIIAYFSDNTQDFSWPNGAQPFSEAQRHALSEVFDGESPELFSMRQEHGCEVVIVDRQDLMDPDFPQADAAVTDLPGVALTIRTADCLPVFLYDPQRRVVGLAHAGWRGSRSGIVSEAVTEMISHFHSSPRDLVVLLGPAIRSCCYEVGDEFLDHFPEGVSLRQGKQYLDLTAVNVAQLVSFGVPRANIHDVGLCTCCEPSCFSYRRQGGQAGRHLSVLMIKSDQGH